MFFEIHVTLIDGVTWLFLDGILLFVGWRVWRLLKVSTFAMFEEKKLTSISEDTSLPPRPEWYELNPCFSEK